MEPISRFATFSEQSLNSETDGHLVSSVTRLSCRPLLREQVAAPSYDAGYSGSFSIWFSDSLGGKLSAIILLCRSDLVVIRWCGVNTPTYVQLRLIIPMSQVTAHFLCWRFSSPIQGSTYQVLPSFFIKK